jgi:tight adherence protein C
VYSAVGVLALASLAFDLAGVGSLGLAVPAGTVTTLLILIRTARRRSKRRHRQALADAAPAAIDLLSACLLAGLNPHLALQRVADRCPDALRAELGRAAAELDLGRSPAAALRAAAERTGLDELRAAAAALEAAARWGMPPSEALAARAEALRTRARLAAEADAGRASVRLAFPLVVCFLPAFVLLTVVPTMAGALHALSP